MVVVQGGGGGGPTMWSTRSMGEPVLFSNEAPHVSVQSQRSDSDQSETGGSWGNVPPASNEEPRKTRKVQKSEGGGEGGGGGGGGGGVKELRSRCGRRPALLQEAHQTNAVEADEGQQEDLKQYKISVRRRLKSVFEGDEVTGNRTSLKRIYTELLVADGPSDGVTASVKGCTIFRTNEPKRIRVVVTNGIAGIGKTFLVHKWTLDWAEGKESQDVRLVILASFRELNLVRSEQHSLVSLLHVLQPSLAKVAAEKLVRGQVVIILDGLDESRLSLDFNNTEVVSDATHKSSVNVLLTNLIQGNLLPSALVWITTRPAAASQIPAELVDRVTTVQGFDNAKKKEFFRRRFHDKDVSSRIISHITTSRSLHAMCRIPVFCWITATVMDHVLTTSPKEKLPKMVTNMFTHFLMVQTKRKKQKYDARHETDPLELTEADRQVLLKLGRLALEHLEKENVTFYDEDIEHFDLDVTEACVYSGLLTENLKTEFVISQKTAYGFVHRSIQEVLAAVYMFHCFTNREENVPGNSWSRHPTDDPPLGMFVRNLIIRSINGCLDLFVHFLHGLCLKSNQRLLVGLLGQMGEGSKSIQKTNLKLLRAFNSSPER